MENLTPEEIAIKLKIKCRYGDQEYCDYGGSPERVRDCTDCYVFIHWERKSIEAELRSEYY